MRTARPQLRTAPFLSTNILRDFSLAAEPPPRREAKGDQPRAEQRQGPRLRSRGGADVDRPGVAVHPQNIGDEDVTQVIRCGDISDRSVIDCEGNSPAEASRTVPTRGTVDTEGEVPGAVPIEGPGGSGQ